MKVLPGILLLFLFMAQANAEPKQYTGTLLKLPLNATLNWLDENNVAGVASSPDSPDRQLTLAGRNTSAGTMKMTLSEGTELIGTVVLKKVTTEASIIWSGTVKFQDGATGPLELRRAR